MTIPPVDKLELRTRLQQQSQRQNKLVYWVSVLLVGILPLIYLAFLAKKFAGKNINWEALRAVQWSKIEADPLQYGMNAFILCLVLLQLLYQLGVQKRERLILTRSGIEYHSPLPAWLQFLYPNWSMSWGQVRALSLQPSKVNGTLQGVTLELATSAGKHRLAPFNWVDPETYQPASPWKLIKQLRRYDAQDLTTQIDMSPLVQYVRAVLPNVPVKRPANLVNTSFAIEKNPSSLTVVAVFLFLALYAVLDGGFLLHETYAQDPPYKAFALAGITGAVVSGFWMLRSQVPMGEGLVMALMAGCGLSMAAYPGALRVNALTDAEGLKTYQYTLTVGRDFQPQTEGLPVLHFDKYYEYWGQFRSGTDYTFQLRRGGLGFYQLNREPIEQAMREFYIKSREKRNRNDSV